MHFGQNQKSDILKELCQPQSSCIIYKYALNVCVCVCDVMCLCSAVFVLPTALTLAHLMKSCNFAINSFIQLQHWLVANGRNVRKKYRIQYRWNICRKCTSIHDISLWHETEFMDWAANSVCAHHTLAFGHIVELLAWPLNNKLISECCQFYFKWSIKWCRMHEHKFMHHFIGWLKWGCLIRNLKRNKSKPKCVQLGGNSIFGKAGCWWWRWWCKQLCSQSILQSDINGIHLLLKLDAATNVFTAYQHQQQQPSRARDRDRQQIML